ncbi:FGGY-family carbohydrate kinase [Thorsellia anophelis]|uniref:L-xylulose kinase n=1 Tax=Thorsellia anophelis DSM 18579 TaxID=1123402 RepID=A0A1I0B7L4_9GAMM|nr:FGGY-family carbohydrate kinase [Thorsellia anophelis]SET02765.1 L-xylulose kinase [Thorsellia anophelis DSM 18579]
MNYYIGIDSGGTFLKAALYSADGVQHAIAKKAVHNIYEQPGWVERDLTDYWHDFVSVIKDLLQQFKGNVLDIKGLSISAQGKGVYLLDKQGHPLGHGITSADGRSIQIVKTWLSAGLNKKIYPVTKQTLWTGHPVSILRWLKEHQPERYEKIGAVLMSHDYLRYCLTGDISAELTNISESNFFNHHTGGYDSGLLAEFGIPEIEPALAKIIQPTQLAGYIHQAASEQTGLPLNLAVYGGLFDVVSTAMCSGIDESNQAINYVMGTWSVTSAIVHQIKPSDYPYVYGYYLYQDQYILHEASPTSASNYEWFAPYLSEDGELNHDLNAEQVAQLPKANSSLYFIPFIYGSNEGLGIKGGFYGLQAHHQRGHLIQAIWEGILFCHYVHLERVSAIYHNAKQLRVTGAAAKNSVWMQMLADLTQMVVIPTTIEEPGALGAALISMLGSGEITHIDDINATLVSDNRVFYPDAQLADVYYQKYLRYRKLVGLLKQFEDSVE